MDLAVAVALQTASAVAVLVLISAGLAIVFGMMRVINLAHGEFLMLGGYVTILAHAQGVNLWLAMLVLAPPMVGFRGYSGRCGRVRRTAGSSHKRTHAAPH